MKKTGQPEIGQINARWEGDEDIVRVNEPPYAATMTGAERDQWEMVNAATRALSGETPVTEGEDKGWRFIGGVKSNQPLFIKDADSGMPLVKVTVEVMRGMPAEFHTRVLPALIKRDKDGGLLRLTIRFDDDSLGYSNQPTEKQMAGLMGWLAKIGGMKPK